MVIGPLSTLSNWVSEVERWCPSMPVILYHGTQSERQALRSKKMSQGSPLPLVDSLYKSLQIAQSTALPVMVARRSAGKHDELRLPGATLLTRLVWVCRERQDDGLPSGGDLL